MLQSVSYKPCRDRCVSAFHEQVTCCSTGCRSLITQTHMHAFSKPLNILIRFPGSSNGRPESQTLQMMTNSSNFIASSVWWASMLCPEDAPYALTAGGCRISCLTAQRLTPYYKISSGRSWRGLNKMMKGKIQGLRTFWWIAAWKCSCMWQYNLVTWEFVKINSLSGVLSPSPTEMLNAAAFPFLFISHSRNLVADTQRAKPAFRWAHKAAATAVHEHWHCTAAPPDLSLPAALRVRARPLANEL